MGLARLLIAGFAQAARRARDPFSCSICAGDQILHDQPPTRRALAQGLLDLPFSPAGRGTDALMQMTHDLPHDRILVVLIRPDLAPRDRSLVTVTALVAVGQAEQVPFHLGKAMDNGLTREEASEALTQLAFYAGWPRVFSAMPVFRNVFDERAAE